MGMTRGNGTETKGTQMRKTNQQQIEEIDAQIWGLTVELIHLPAGQARADREAEISRLVRVKEILSR
jgi:hypothetical protein